jgi:hypothetical protein
MGADSRQKMGAESRQIGRKGEALFWHLAAEWGEHETTPAAMGTDGYLRWPNVLANRLFVQVKTKRKRGRQTNSLPVTISATHLRDWYSYRPLLILCVLEEGRAWWKDTAEEEWPQDPRKSKTFRVPLNQPVDATTKDAVQKIALQRPRYLGPGVIGLSAPEQSLTGIELVPEELRRLSTPDMLYILKDIYKEMGQASIVERDGMALAAARLIHCNLPLFEKVPIEDYLELVRSRLLSTQQGGRSYTLGALASLLHPGLNHPFDAAFIEDLEKVAERAVKAGTFVNPEFALIIGASLVARFPDKSHLSDHIRDLTQWAVNNPQNSATKQVALLIQRNFEQRETAVTNQLDRGNGIAKHILRPLRQDDEIFAKLEEAIAAAWRVVESTPAAASQQDLSLFNQLTRFQASDLLQRLRKRRRDRAKLVRYARQNEIS